MDSADDLTRLEVDGEVFHVAGQAGRPGQYHYKWVSGRDPQYGFSSARSDGQPESRAGHVASIRDFLAQIDPNTGYIED